MLEHTHTHTHTHKLVDWVLWHINFCRLFNVKSALFQTIQFSMSTQFVKIVQIQLIKFGINTDFVYTQLNVKPVLY